MVLHNTRSFSSFASWSAIFLSLTPGHFALQLLRWSQRKMLPTNTSTPRFSSRHSAPFESPRKLTSPVFGSARTQQVKRSPADPAAIGLILINLQLACQSPGWERQGGVEAVHRRLRVREEVAVVDGADAVLEKPRDARMQIAESELLNRRFGMLRRWYHLLYPCWKAP